MYVWDYYVRCDVACLLRAGVRARVVFRCFLPFRRWKVPRSSLACRCWSAGNERSVASVYVTAFASVSGLGCCGMFPFYSCIPLASANAISAFALDAATSASPSSCVALAAIATALARLAKLATTPELCA